MHMQQSLQIGSIISRGFSILFKNFVPFMVLTTIVYTPVIILAFVSFSWAEAGTLDENTANIVGFVDGVGSYLLNLVASAALMYGVIQQLRGQHASMGAAIAVGLKRLLPVLGTGLLMMICLALGYMALVIPGIILTMMFYVAVPVSVIEKLGPGAALARSRELTNGYKVTLLGLNIVLVLLLVIGSVVAGLVIAVVAAFAPILMAVGIGVALNIFFGALNAVIAAIVYYDLRTIKEGVNVDDLVRVFE